MSKSKRVELSEVVCHFRSLEDPRSSINRRHPLIGVVVTSLMAVLSGADGPTGIHKWAEAKRELLRRALPLPNGIPSKDVFRRVLMAIKPAAFQACFVNWLNAMRSAANSGSTASGDAPTLAIDGKTLRGSHDRRNGLGPLHLVSVWMSEAGLTLGQVATDAKSNEITAIPELLKLVDVSGAIVTIDAMGTQTAIAEQIINNGGDYVLALKGNQSGLHQAVIAHVNDHLNDDFARVKVRRHVVSEQKHGRREKRSYIQLPVPADLPGRKRWKGLRTIGVVVYESYRGDEETLEVP